MPFPTPGGDFHTWGTKLIGALKNTLTDDGDLKPAVIEDLLQQFSDRAETLPGLQGPEGPEGPPGDLSKSVADTLYADKAIEDTVAPIPGEIIALTPGEGEVVTATSSGLAGWDNKVFDASHPRWGIAGDGSTDDTAALQAMADACESASGTFLIPEHMSCQITSTLDLRYIRDVDVRGKIKVAHTSGIGVLAGDTSQTVFPAKVLLNEVTYAAGGQTNICIRLVGMKNGKVRINYTDYVQVYADYGDVTMRSFGYTDFWPGYITKMEFLSENGDAWINGNTFWGGRIKNLILASGPYNHNGNLWYRPMLELSTITFEVGVSNYILGARFEGGATITMGAETYRNVIVQDWKANHSAMRPGATISDSGWENQILTESERDSDLLTVFRMDASGVGTSASNPWNVPHVTARVQPGFRKLSLSNNFAEYYDTGIFPLDITKDEEGGASLRRMIFRSDAALWRPRVYVYDADRQPLDGGSGGPYLDTIGGWTWNASGYYAISGTNIGPTPVRLIFRYPDAKYARIVLVSGSSVTATPFTYAELLASVMKPSGDQILRQVQQQSRRPLSQAGTTPPTKSLLHRGAQVGTDSGILTLTHRVDTTLGANAATSATAITLTSATGINSGDTIAILLDDDTTHFTTVSGAPAGNDVTLATGLPSAAASGNQVATQRWLHIT